MTSSSSLGLNAGDLTWMLSEGETVIGAMCDLNQQALLLFPVPITDFPFLAAR